MATPPAAAAPVTVRVISAQKGHGAPEADGGDGEGTERDDDAVGDGCPGEFGSDEHHASGEVPAALVPAVGAPADDDGEDCGEQIRHSGIAGDHAGVVTCFTGKAAEH